MYFVAIYKLSTFFPLSCLVVFTCYPFTSLYQHSINRRTQVYSALCVHSVCILSVLFFSHHKKQTSFSCFSLTLSFTEGEEEEAEDEWQTEEDFCF